ncbi:MAG: CHC2 zinc finger domain-containing protein [Planctomycetia bacterium]|nr:CHC2 zinc finger domain-containing protein [Planctomycetia bacterium]
MSFGYSLELKEQIRQATDIVQLVGEYVRLMPKGRIFVGLCPWHDDSSPSLQVNPERQVYRCWVCNVGGDVFSFIMKMQNLTFPEALEFLAERAGIPLPEKKKFRPFSSYSSSGHASRGNLLGEERGSDLGGVEGTEEPAEITKKSLFAASAWAEEQYHQCLLASEDAQVAREYFSQRKITEESIRKFSLGFAPPEWGWLQKRLKGKSISRLSVLEAAGVLGHSERGGYYDRFRGRVIFPIHDVMKRSVGMGGRTIPGVQTQNESAKYVNTPETLLFKKRKMLYALDLALETIRKTRRVLVTEGYMDTIVAHQYGFTDTVAVLGTAVGMDHIQVLKRHADTIFLVLDGDAAGQRRTLEVLSLFVAKSVDVRILTLAEGMDPAEFLLAYGAADFEKLLQSNAVDALQHAYEVYTKDLDTNNVNASEQALENILKLMAEGVRYARKPVLETTFREFKLLQNLSFLFRVPETILQSRLNELRSEVRREGYVSQEMRREEGGSQGKSGFVSPGISADLGGNFPENEDKDLQEKKNFSKSQKNLENFSFPPSHEADETIKLNLSIKEDAIISKTEQDAQDFFTAFEAVVNDQPDLHSGEYFLQNADTVDWAIYGKMDVYQQELLELLIYRPSFLSLVRHKFPVDQFSYVPARELVIRMCEMEDDGVVPTLERLLLIFESEAIHSWLVSLEEKSALKLNRKTDEELMAVLEELLSSYERFQLQSQKLVHTSVFRSQDLDEEQKASMLEELIQEARKKLY